MGIKGVLNGRVGGGREVKGVGDGGVKVVGVVGSRR